MIFVDTSAFFAIMDRDDDFHEPARDQWTSLLSDADRPGLITSNYVLVESFALVQARLGLGALRLFSDSVLPVVRAHWVSQEDHDAASHALLTANRRDLSLVDCVSFHVMRQLGIQQAFAFDRDFAKQGFETLPHA